jgi:hypothetical protein
MTLHRNRIQLFFVYRLKSVFMKHLFIVVACISLSAQAQLLQDRLFTPSELSGDLDHLIQSYERIHPNLYAHVSRDTIAQRVHRVRQSLQEPISRLEFARRTIPVVTALRDAHTSLAFPQDERTAYLKQGGLVFPLDVRILENKLYITANYSTDSTLAVNTRIISINGKPAEDLLVVMRQYISAELDAYRDVRIAREFRRLYWNVYGASDSYELVLADRDGVRTQVVKGITAKELEAAFLAKGRTLTIKPYSYYKLTDQIGVIDFRSMSDPDKFSAFLDSTFAVIAHDSVKHLVIDIRNNSGGNSALAHNLFNYITPQPYRMVDLMEVRISREVRKNMRQNYMKWYLYPVYPFLAFNGQARAYLFGKIGKVRAFPIKHLQTPGNPPHKFCGPTYLLTSTFTFSSANMLAAGYKFYDMGTVVGEETGGVLDAYGDLIKIELPATKLVAYSSHKHFIHPGHDGTLHGVRPDYEVRATEADIQVGRDVVMEFVKKLIER